MTVQNRAAQLVIEGVAIPSTIIASGHCAAHVCKENGEVAVFEDRAYCESCGHRNEFYHEACRNCAGPKPWIYREDL